MSKQLCAASYRAETVDDVVIVHATGVHATTGFRSFFEPLKRADTFALYHEAPHGNVLQTITPFAVSTSYKTRRKVTTVTVIDISGQHQIQVEPIAKEALSDPAGKQAEEGYKVLASFEDGSTEQDFRNEGRGDLRTSTGYAASYSFEDALKNAIANLPPEAPETPEEPRRSTRIIVEVVSIHAELGGLTNIPRLAVSVAAYRG